MDNSKEIYKEMQNYRTTILSDEYKARLFEHLTNIYPGYSKRAIEDLANTSIKLRETILEDLLLKVFRNDGTF